MAVLSEAYQSPFTSHVGHCLLLPLMIGLMESSVSILTNPNLRVGLKSGPYFMDIHLNVLCQMIVLTLHVIRSHSSFFFFLTCFRSL
jgi:hypothetical protein